MRAYGMNRQRAWWDRDDDIKSDRHRGRELGRDEIREQLQDTLRVHRAFCWACLGTGAECLAEGCGCCTRCADQPTREVLQLARDLAGRLDCEEDLPRKNIRGGWVFPGGCDSWWL